MAAKRIVFIGHAANLSGAPVLLLNLLLVLKRHAAAEVILVISRGGSLMPAYRQNFAVLELKPDGYGKGNILKRVTEIAKNRLNLLRFRAIVRNADLVVSNTVVNGKLLEKIAGLGKPMITYVHELEDVVNEYLRTGDAGFSIHHVNRIAYPSQKVRDTLVNRFGVPAAKMYKLSYFFPVDAAIINDEQRRQVYTSSFKQRFGIPDGDMLVGGMGMASQRKGTDIFLRVCAAVTSVNPRICFRWIGSFEHAAAEAALQQVLHETGLEGQGIFTGPMPHNYFNPAPFDLLFLSSREDPYPLVVLEAGFMKVPTMCFEHSGGITEFVMDDAGWLIPGFSVEKAAAAILALYGQRQLLAQKGQRAQEKSLQWHASDTVVLEQFRQLTEGL